MKLISSDKDKKCKEPKSKVVKEISEKSAKSMKTPLIEARTVEETHIVENPLRSL